MSKIKLCGLTRNEDIEAVNQLLPDYIGFVFAGSKRQVSREQAEDLKIQLDSRIQVVGVFVNHSFEEILELAKAGTIDVIQLHGDESEEMVRQIKRAAGKPVIKAVSVRSQEDIKTWQDSEADYLLFDYGKGGTGTVFNWSCLEQAGAIKKPFFLAGGLNCDNLEAALAFEPFCVDVSSGAESDGQKDRDKMNKLIEIVRRNN